MSRYGLTGKLLAQPGKRDDLIALLRRGATSMESEEIGCLMYLICKASDDENGIWVHEMWTSKEAHDASLSVPAVREVIGQAMPIIAGMANQFEYEPVAGIGMR